MKKYVVFVIFIGTILTQEISGNVESRIVNITQGPVLGYLDQDRSVYSFYGIPYATAPTGSHKFRAPLPPPVWNKPFKAVDRKIICPQFLDSKGPSPFDMREDCLIANVFVPKTIANNLSVLVSIHGGAYQLGFGNQDKYSGLVELNKLIVVTFNYRLGVHGFLCLGTEDAPGNAGMKDQVALLRWVQANIANFGGNPSDVTLIGCSAGGGSVHALMLSKMTDSLFKKAIPESGVSIGSAGVLVDPMQNAKIYAKILNFSDVDDVSALESFYKNATYELLTSGVDVIMNRPDSSLLFGLCLEREIGSERFLDDTPQNIFKTGQYKKLPLLYGFTQGEGLLRLPQFYIWKDKMNKKFSDFLPPDLHFDNETQMEKVAETVRSFYFGNLSVGEATILNYRDYFSDVMFVYPMLNALKLHTEYNNDTIYLYQYTFVDENASTVIPYTNKRGVNHCDQVFAVMDEDKTNISAAYKNMKKTMMSLWLNFILNGNPRSEDLGLPGWPPVSRNRSPHMALGSKIELKGAVLEGRAAFWDKLYQQYYREPITP